MKPVIFMMLGLLPVVMWVLWTMINLTLNTIRPWKVKPNE
jgi:hypothetical protein